jgi:DNA (cytosine-5)-methyltransferase 1
MRQFYEFFAGGGMARLGLGTGWTCLFANDFDEKKCATYVRNWGNSELRQGDVADLTTDDLPGYADLAWASFPCQDLSLAGPGGGLDGERSGTFWPFWRLIEGLRSEGRAPRVVVLENVAGALTSHRGRDFAAIGTALAGAGYRFGALVVDAERFLPQSRPRLFVVAADRTLSLPASVWRSDPDPAWSPRSLQRATTPLDRESRSAWIWWRLPQPSPRRTELADLLESEPKGVRWHSPAQTQRLLDLMTTVNRAKVERVQQSGRRSVGTIYRRTRPDQSGVGRQRAEIRFDGVSGCLRTGSGGSSRQFIMVVDGDTIRSRLLSTREAARLMGLPDSYELPDNYREGYHLAGDGVVVPVVRHIAERLLEPALDAALKVAREAA